MRMRVQAFENIVRQPVFWFELKNSLPINIINRLARDGPLVKSVSINVKKKFQYFKIVNDFLGWWFENWSSYISLCNTVSCSSNCFYFWLETSYCFDFWRTNNCRCCLQTVKDGTKKTEARY